MSLTLEPQEGKPDIIQMVGGWLGVCVRCGRRRWVSAGWATFYAIEGDPKGWHGWGPEHEACLSKCDHPWFPGRTAVLEPADLDEQRPLVSAYLVGGMAAVKAMIDGHEGDL